MVTAYYIIKVIVLVSIQEQYVFLYRAIREYVESLSAYSNFQ